MATDAMIFCITRSSTPMALLIIQDNEVLVVEKYWYILAIFLWLLKLEWLGHIFVKINYILSLFSLKNISLGDTCWVQRAVSIVQYWCAGALSSMPNTDQDQMSPLWVFILKANFSDIIPWTRNLIWLTGFDKLHAKGCGKCIHVTVIWGGEYIKYCLAYSLFSKHKP